MKTYPIIKFIQAAAVAVLAAHLSGCASNGYITSSITTAIGLDVSENPQTQVPHVRFGYIRTGLYYIPTGKTGQGGTGMGNGLASDTPHVVSTILVSTKFLSDLTISEQFAVGQDAANSAGAQQMFAAAPAIAAANNQNAPTVLQNLKPIQLLKPVTINTPVQAGIVKQLDVQQVIRQNGTLLRKLSKDQAQKALAILKPGSTSDDPQGDITELNMDATTTDQALKIQSALKEQLGE